MKSKSKYLAILLIILILSVSCSKESKGYINEDEIDISKAEKVTSDLSDKMSANDYMMNGNTEVSEDKIFDGSPWLASDNSIIIFNEDGRFKYYMDFNNLEDNYYEGEYKTFVDDRAIENVYRYSNEIGMELDLEELKEGVAKNEKLLGKHNFLSLILDNEKLVIDGVEDESFEGHETVYLGYYYDKDGVFNLTNIGTQSNGYFIKYK